MPKSHTVARSLHDIGLAAWFGGSLMGAVGLNAASRMAGEPKERARVADAGWARWTGPNAIAIGAHLAGGALLLRADATRVVAQRGAPTATIAKAALTGVALGATAWARIEGQKLMEAGDPPVLDATTPSEDTPPEVAAAQRRLKLLQWAIPLSTGGLLVLAAVHGEQERPAQVASGVLKRVLPDAVPEWWSGAQGRKGRAGRKLTRRQRRALGEAALLRWARAQELAPVVVERAGQVVERAQPVVSRAGQAALEAAERAQPVVSRAGHAALERAQLAAERAQPVLSQAGHVARERAQQAAERAQPYVERAVERSQPLVERAGHAVAERSQPLVERAQTLAAEGAQRLATRTQPLDGDHAGVVRLPAGTQVLVL